MTGTELGRARMKLITTSVKWTGFSMFTERIKKGIIRASFTQQTIFTERQILIMKKKQLPTIK